MPDRMIHLYGWDDTNKAWKKVLIDVNGKIQISDADPFTIQQTTPENLRHVPFGYDPDAAVYRPYKVDANGSLVISLDANYSKLTVAKSQVFSGTSPTAWTDLDLSSVIGVNPALALLEVGSTGGNLDAAFRPNGDADAYATGSATGLGANCISVVQNYYIIVIISTDNNGVIEWASQVARSGTTVKILAYVV